MDRRLIFDGEQMRADLVLEDGRVALTDGLDTAVILSLFTDRQARPDDPLPDGADGDRRGWCLDPKLGSRLWLLGREKQVSEVRRRAKEYAEEALAWLVTDKVASQVEVIADWVRPGMLGLRILITRRDGQPVELRYDFAWRPHAL